MRLLVCHALHSQSRQTTLDHVSCYRQCRPEHEYVFHHINAPVSRALKEAAFDGIILNYCFLAHRTSSNFEEQKGRYAWLADHPAPIVAVPQDDFTCNRLLDDWLFELNAAVVFSPIAEGLDHLYPRCHGSKPFELALTGYSFGPQDRVSVTDLVPWRERRIDVGSRVSYTQPHYGVFGQEKGRQARRFAEALDDRGLVIDISTDPADAFTGSDWNRFLGSCRFTVGMKGGASLADPDGSLKGTCEAFLARHPEASFAEVEAACFSGLDRRFEFSAVSPRLFEAAAAGTCQILRPDHYVEGFEPWVHYVPLESDHSNLDEVVEAIQDPELGERLARAAYERLIASGEFEYGSYVDRVLDGFRRFEAAGDRRGDAISALDPHLLWIERLEKLENGWGGDFAQAARLLLMSNLDQEQLHLVRNIMELVRERGRALSWHQMLPYLSGKFVSARIGELTVELVQRCWDRGCLEDLEPWLAGLESGELTRINLNGWLKL